jgi:diaminopimelate decarboxylase
MSTMDKKFPLEKLKNIPTPFYYYDLDVLRSTLDLAKKESEKHGYKLHYAVKANANPRLLKIISSFGIGADCVSWNEIERALSTGFKPEDIVFAGVGKSDRDIEAAIRDNIFCFNVESIPELEVINSIAAGSGKAVLIALRINPYVEAHTHKYITTGIEESKFGIGMWELDNVLMSLKDMKNVNLKGIHFHIGSQVTKLSVFESLCSRINAVRDWFISRNIILDFINAGGGLGIDYKNPDLIPVFGEYFSIFHKLLKLRSDQVLHFEPGRSITGQCGTLITRVLYVKNGGNSRFVVVDAGMTDLLRPALYQAFHKIENLSSDGRPERYDIVGPVCESSDTFGKYIELPDTKRGDIIAIRSAGAYGEVMASRYNLRNLPGTVFSDQI